MLKIQLVKKASQGNILEFFPKVLLKLKFEMKDLTWRWTQSEPVFQIHDTFLIFKNVQGRPSPSSCAPVSVTEYAAISLNIPKCWWKCLNKLLWRCQGFAYAWSSYMFDRLLKMFPVLNDTVVYAMATQSSEYLWRWLNTRRSTTNHF